MSAPHIVSFFLFCAKNYQSWWKFDKTQTKQFCNFLRHGLHSEDKIILSYALCLLQIFYCVYSG